MATASKRITSQSIRENAKKDHSPKWDNANTWSGPQFKAHYRDAMSYYNLNFSGKDLKPKVLEWMAHVKYDKKLIAAFKKTKDWRSNLTMGAIASCLLRGMPAVHAGFNEGRDTSAWLRKEIEIIIEEGKDDIEVVAEDKTKTVAAPTPNIQDRIREQAVQMSEELFDAVENFIEDAEKFDPKAFKIVNLLRGKGAKAAHARYIKSFFVSHYNELMELSSGNAHEQLREAYKHRPRKHVKKIVEFYETLFAACEQISAEAKVLKKPRAKKIKPAEDLVKKIKFKVSDDKLGITSVPPSGIVGAQGVVVFHTITRKIGYYIAKTSAGLSVKGASIIEFTEKSVQKTLRKPAEQIKEYKEQNTQRRFEAWFTKSVKTTETALNGRLNEDIIILKIYK